MTKREKFLFVVVFVLFIASTGSAVFFVVQYLNTKVEKVNVEQKLHRTKNELELKKLEIEEKEKKIGELKKKINELKEKVQRLLARIKELKEENEELVKDLSELKEDFADVDNALSEKDGQIARLKHELMRTRERLFRVEREFLRLHKKSLEKTKVTSSQGGRGGQETAVSLGKIVVGTSDSTAGSSSTSGASRQVRWPARVLAINKKYNFAILGLPRGVLVKAGTRIRVIAGDGVEFDSVIDTVRKNLITLDVPKDLTLTIGDTVSVVLLEE